MEPIQLRVGLIGLGIMGLPMARNILKAGLPLTAWNRSAGRFAPLEGSAAALAASPRALAARSNVIVLMLTGPEAIEEVLDGQDGLIGALGPGRTVVNMSTVSPAYAASLAARVAGRGARYVDAPVSGSKKPAEDGTLVILAGGEEEAVAGVEPVLLAVGSKVVRCGEVPAGSMMKMSVNLLLASMMEGLAEMLHFGSRGGLDVATMLDVVLSGPLANDFIRLKEPLLREGRFTPQFPAKHMAKDLKFVVDTAYETGAATPSANQNLLLFRRVVELGLGEEDFSAVLRALEPGAPKA
jgi:3-hydroxyisobutyrate dehydrogenase-like beta-hydroxyacid dehydrogenase